MGRRKLTDAPQELSQDDKRLLNDWLRRKIRDKELPPGYWKAEQARAMVERCFIYHRARGIQRASWLATCQEWIHKQAVLDGWKGPRMRRSPSEGPKQVRLDLGTALANNSSGRHRSASAPQHIGALLGLHEGERKTNGRGKWGE